MEKKKMAWNSVHGGCCGKRFVEAKNQNEKKDFVNKEDLWEKVIEYCKGENICIEYCKIEIDENQINNETGDVKLNYTKIKEKYSLKDKRDIVWIKFAQNGRIGVVASSNDVNFQIPDKNKKENYDDKTENGRWIYNSSGIILRSLDLEWDRKRIVLFAIKSRPNDMTRHGVEKIIGNYLTEEMNVPILDYYSHRIGGR